MIRMRHIPLLCSVFLCCPSMFESFVLNRERALQYDGNLGDYFDKEKELLNLQDQYIALKDEYEFEKFYHMLMRRGSKYLNGLKNALQYFVVETEHCDDDRTLNQNLTLQFIANATLAAAIANSTQNYAELDGENVMGNTTRRCQYITRSREDIISLIDLAAYTAEMAEEARKYDPDEEIMHIAKLAKLLSILADKSGYRPKAEDFVNLDYKDSSKKKESMKVSKDIMQQMTQTLTDVALAEANRQNNFTHEHKKEYYFDPHARSKRQIVVTEDDKESNLVQPLENYNQTNTTENTNYNQTIPSNTTENTSTNRSDTSSNYNQTTNKGATSNSSDANKREKKARVIKDYDKAFFNYRKYDLGDHFKYKKGRNVSDFDAMAAALIARDQALIFSNPPNEMAYRYGGAFVPGLNQFAFAFARYIVEAERP